MPIRCGGTGCPGPIERRYERSRPWGTRDADAGRLRAPSDAPRWRAHEAPGTGIGHHSLTRSPLGQSLSASIGWDHGHLEWSSDGDTQALSAENRVCHSSRDVRVAGRAATSESLESSVTAADMNTTEQGNVDDDRSWCSRTTPAPSPPCCSPAEAGHRLFEGTVLELRKGALVTHHPRHRGALHSVATGLEGFSCRSRPQLGHRG